MALLDFWRSSAEAVLRLNIQQIVAAAGDGRLRDGSECSAELCRFLREVQTPYLYPYIEHCLERSFNESGLVLQDLVNEVGHRLEFEVENGLYRGKRNSVGFDGVWRSGEIPEILVEVKTTDYITVPLEKIAEYKRRLQAEGKISEQSSILIVVGREDTGALEAQIRGSRYAWDMRLISADRLSALLNIKEKSEADTTVRQIKELLRPFEYTKIDRIIDVMFATAEDVQSVESEEVVEDVANGRHVRTSRERLEQKRLAAADAVSNKLGTSLVRHRKTLFWSSDKKSRICVAVSKRYERDYQPYWYAYHPPWDEFLKGGDSAFFVLACMDRDEAYAIPLSDLAANLPNLNVSSRERGDYWHLALTLGEGGELLWNMPSAGKRLPLAPYAVALNRSESSRL